jgi:hypothetical protein
MPFIDSLSHLGRECRATRTQTVCFHGTVALIQFAHPSRMVHGEGWTSDFGRVLETLNQDRVMFHHWALGAMSNEQ